MAETESFKDALRRMRRAEDLSLRVLARRAVLSPGHLSKIENGLRPATPGVAKALDRALSAKGELAMLAQLERTRRVQKALPFDPVRRRTVFALGLAPLAAGHESEPGQRRKIDAEDVRELQEAASWLYGLDYQHGGALLWRAADASAEVGYDKLENGILTERIEAKMLRATSRIQMCAGWLAFDSGQHSLARNRYNEALALSRQSGDAEVEAHALSNLAFQCNILGRPREALRFVEGAIRASSSIATQPRLSAIPQLRRSVSLSLCQDRQGFERAINAARRILDRDHDKPTEEWCTFLTPAELDGVEATGLAELRQSRRAAVLFERAISGYSDNFARNRALYRVRLAHARLELKHVDGAAESASSALDDLNKKISSWRIERELAHVAQQMAPYSQDSLVADFLMKYEASPRKETSTTDRRRCSE